MKVKYRKVTKNRILAREHAVGMLLRAFRWSGFVYKQVPAKRGVAQGAHIAIVLGVCGLE